MNIFSYISKHTMSPRWLVYYENKPLNCFQKIKRCHSMNFEDYSICPTKIQNEKKTLPKKEYTISGEDISVIALTLL